ncbi:hypothetical protein C7974DRAFT_419747 [Boeremia exigua]|uniref:uncharacterized protein n=1 Tax=Boeremia exigua TaxID=749465 RepID=UPI001E8CF2F8|nr:uncharacterized protein C7974DRAFT_419747 [Boeremia exigua]KAH6644230.1 hypothetical protein C7974DRAFT_419747 [Boeremia exigua]
MADSSVKLRIAELRAELEALEQTLSLSEQAGNDVKIINDPKEESQRLETTSAVPPNEERFAGPGQDNSSSDIPAPNSDRIDDVDSDRSVLDPDQNSVVDSTLPLWPRDVATIPQLNRVNWTQFKNSTMNESRVYAIDVLMGPAKFYWQRRGEELHSQRRASKATSGEGSSVFTANEVVEPQPKSMSSNVAETTHEMPERIRINCKKLLGFLGELGESSMEKSTVLLRPYKLLVRHDSAIRRRLQDLEERHSESSGESLSRRRSTDGSTPQLALAENAASENQPLLRQATPLVKESADGEFQSEIESLRCLVQFMDVEILPVYQRCRSSDLKKIYFHDLWFFYRPGDLAVSWTNLDEGSTSSPGKGPPTIWRILAVSKGRSVLGVPHGQEDERLRPPTIKINRFEILCHIISYDGTSFGPLDHTFSISPFDGQKEIGVLDPCPLRYVENSVEIEEQLVARGRKFVQYTKPTHSLYVGNTLCRHPCGLVCKMEPSSKPVDGPVIVDFKEAKRENSHWVANHGMPTASGGSGLEFMEDYPNNVWEDETYQVLKDTTADLIYADDGIDAADMDDLVASNAFLATQKYSSGDLFVDYQAFDRMDYALLPDRVVGFDLHRRRFAILALDCLHPMQVSKEGWADLKLPRGHKHMVQAQIKTHFMDKQSRKMNALQDPDIDLVRGKGMGLIILLHGAPGVGKTSTAECVAESLKKPLYPITCGDLGVTAAAVESELNSTFAKAEIWDCVLLLDEADVFLAQRTRTDLKRNAIVSVFLRVLEYYKGILILTTNRVGAFDEAFKSRIHLHLYYPALNQDQTAAIWKMNLDRVIKRQKGRVTADEPSILRFAAAHFAQNKKTNTRWNGRQIRNAFQTAVAMAQYEALESTGLAGSWDSDVALEDVRSELKVAHFETVADASSQFDMYIAETIGSTDSKRAYMDRDRADHFAHMVPLAQNAQYGGQPAWSAHAPFAAYNQAGPSAPYTHAGTSNTFASPPRARQGEMPSPHPPAPMQSAFRHGQAIPGGQQTHPFAQDPHVQQSYMAHTADYGSPGPVYPLASGMRPSVSPAPPDLFTAQTPVTTGASQSHDDDGY